MKTSKEQLINRGYLDNQQVFDDINQALIYLDDHQAVNRSKAINTLLTKNYSPDLLIDQLIVLLTKEKALYTKIYLCQYLSHVSIKGIEALIPYLGKIGNNQYHQLPDSISLKKSYPLPRDIVARTLGKCDKRYLSHLLKQVNYPDNTVVYELIDAIGYLLFSNQEYDNQETYQCLKTVFDRHKDDELMVFKVVTSLSMCNQATKLLEFIKSYHYSNIINQNVERSIKIINNRK